MCARLLGSYPSANPSDPQVYAAELVRVLMGFSIRAAQRGIEKAMEESPSFLPAVPAIRKACDGSRLGSGEDWEVNSRLQLRERERIARENNQESLEYRRAVVKRLWPRAAL